MNFGENIRKERKKRNLTLEQLADITQVSRAMLSKIERGEKSPTLQTVSQIAEGLNVTISYLLGEHDPPRNVLLLRKEDRFSYTDPVTGFERHLLSPSVSTKGIEFILNKIPPYSESGVFPAHKEGVKEYVYVQQGKLAVELGCRDEAMVLEEGDSLFFHASTTHRFKNLSGRVCLYYLIIDSRDVPPSEI